MKKIFLASLSFFMISVMSLVTFSAEPTKFIVLDVRTPAEYSESHVVDTTNVDFLNPNFKSEIAKYDRTTSYKLYCRSGNRSTKAIQIMKELGFSQLENLGSLQEAAKKLNRKCEPAGC